MVDLTKQFSKTQSATVNQKKYMKRASLESPILYQSNKLENQDEDECLPPDFYVVTDTPLRPVEVKRLKNLITKIVEKEISNSSEREIPPSFHILSALQFFPSGGIKTKKNSGDLDRDILKFYVDNKFQSLDSIIKKGIPIISLGRAQFSLLETDDLDCSKISDDENEKAKSENKQYRNSIVQGFYDNLLFKTSFHSPEFSSQIFPVDGYTRLYSRVENRFLDNFEMQFFKKQILKASQTIPSRLRIKPIKKIFVEDPNTFLRERLNDRVLMAYDLETRGLDPLNYDKAGIICFTCSFDGKTGYYLPFENINIELLGNFLETKITIGSHLKYDCRWLHLHGKIPAHQLHIDFDTEQMSHICNENHRRGLKSGTYLWTPYGGYDKKLDEYFKENPSHKRDWSLVPFNLMFEYATQDPCMSFQMFEALLGYIKDLDILYPNTEHLDENGEMYSLSNYLHNTVMPLVNVHLQSELEGFPVDAESLLKLGRKIEKDVYLLEESVLTTLNLKRGDINLGSNEQLGEAIERCGWSPVARTEKGFYQVNKATLAQWRREGIEGAKLIEALHKKEQTMHTFVNMPYSKKLKKKTLEINDLSEIDFTGKGGAYWKHIRPYKGGYYMFPENKSFLAGSHRHRASAPNMSQISVRGEDAIDIRRIFITPNNDEYYWISPDASGVQLRIATILSGDSVLMDEFINGSGDVHSMTGHNVFCRDERVVDLPNSDGGIRLLDIGEKVEGSRAMNFKDFRYLLKNGNKRVKQYRTYSKSLNFLLLFLGKPSLIHRQFLAGTWEENQLDEYIEKNKLSGELRATKSKKTKFNFQKLSKEQIVVVAKYLVVASHIHQNFFDTYSGLSQWHKDYVAFANKHGYMRSIHGVFRRLAYLSYQGRDSEKGRIANLHNISCNSPTQTTEVYIMARMILKSIAEFKKRDIDFIYKFQIHDAHCGFAKKDQINDIYSILYTYGEMDYPEYNGVPIEFEGDLCDMTYPLYYENPDDSKEISKKKMRGWKQINEVWEIGRDFEREGIEELKVQYRKELG